MGLGKLTTELLKGRAYIGLPPSNLSGRSGRRRVPRRCTCVGPLVPSRLEVDGVAGGPHPALSRPDHVWLSRPGFSRRPWSWSPRCPPDD